MTNFQISGFDMKLEIPSNVFQPNTTTYLLAKHMNNVKGKTVLDLGCGAGPIAITAALKGAEKVYAVDIMGEACQAALENAKRNGVADCVEVHNGDLFAPINGLRFDIIVNDVSGMAEEVSRISPWYPEPIPTGGREGTVLTERMLRDSPSFLNEGGYLLFPVISLARSEVILSVAEEVYSEKVHKVASRIIPFCEELQRNIELLLRLKEKGIINFTKKRSRYLWYLDIYRVNA